MNATLTYRNIALFGSQIPRAFSHISGSFTSVSLDAAEALGKCTGPLNLDGLPRLSPAIATALVTHQGPLSLQGIQRLDDDTAEILSMHRGILILDGLKEFDDAPGHLALAAQMASTEARINFHNLKYIPTAVAEQFIPHKGHLVVLAYYLNCALTPMATWRALSRHRGPLTVAFSPFSDPHDDIVSALAEHRGDLKLSGIRTLTRVMAAALANHDGTLEIYSCNTDQVAALLSEHEGPLVLGGIAELSSSSAFSLSVRPGAIGLPDLGSIGSMPGHISLAQRLAKSSGALCLSSLKSIPNEIADALSAHRGFLDLSGLQSISNEAADALARHKGALFLKAWDSMTKQAAEALASHEGPVIVSSSNHTAKNLLALILSGQWPIPDLPVMDHRSRWLEVKTSLGAQELLLLQYSSELSGELRELTDTDESCALAKFLVVDAKNKGGMLRFPFLSVLSASPAQELAQHFGDLDLPGLTTLSDAAARSLSAHVGWLQLSGLPSLSDASAESLSTHRGALALDGLQSLSAAAVRALCRHEGPVMVSEKLDNASAILNERSFNLSDITAAALSLHGAGQSMYFIERIQKFTDQIGHLLLARRMEAVGYSIVLPDLEELSVECAETFTRTKWCLENTPVGLEFGRLEELSLPLALILGRHKGDVKLKGLKNLPASIASALSQNPWKLDLRGLGSLSDEAAKALAESQSLEILVLSGGISFSELAAITLARGRFEFELHGQLECLTLLRAMAGSHSSLDFEGIESISDAAAQILVSDFKKPLPAMVGLRTLSDTPTQVALANALTEERDFLQLTELMELSEGAAEALSRYGGKDLILPGLPRMSDAIASSLSEYQGRLRLNGLLSMTDEPGHVALATKLASSVEDLELPNLTILPDRIVRILVQHQGKRLVIGFTTLSDSLSELLAGYKGNLELPSLRYIPKSPNQLALVRKLRLGWELSKLTQLSEEVAAALVENSSDQLCLDGVATVSIGTATTLASYKGKHLSLGVAQLSPEIADILSRFEGTLSLPRLSTLSASAAEALARHRFVLLLNSLDDLSNAVAIALAKHEGSQLWLTGLWRLSNADAEALMSYRGVIRLKTLGILSQNIRSQRRACVFVM